MKKILLLLLVWIGTLWGEIIVGAERSSEYLPLLQGKNVAMVVNHSSLVEGEHLVDRLLREGVRIRKIFASEHG
ncbi:MAG TPA: DUF1343 domain-containing protein, partial [Campylobacterales bacterium]|nr:DUF1343 domain-containing protein [Campylobacterales bacterium]